MAFSKLIYAEKLSALLSIDLLYKGSINKQETITTVYTGEGTSKALSSGYSEDAQKAIAFTGDEFIVNHNHQYYTGIPFLMGTFGDDNDFLAFDNSSGTPNIHKGEILPTAIWKGDLLSSSSLTTLSGGTKYSVQVDESGHAFVAVDGASSHALNVTKAAYSVIPVKGGDGTDKNDIKDDSTTLTYNPNNQTTSLSIIDSKSTGASSMTNQFVLVNTYKAMTLDASGTWTASATDTVEKMTVHITPEIAQNVIAKTDGAGTGKSGLANHLVWFESDQANSSAIQVADSGITLSTTSDFTKDATNTALYKPSSSVVPTEAAIAEYFKNSLGNLTGAMRFKGVANGSSNGDDATDDTTKNADGTAINDAWTVSGTFNTTAPAIASLAVTIGSGDSAVTYQKGDLLPMNVAANGDATTNGNSAVANSDMDYKQGDVYYVQVAGWYAGQYCELGDMLVAIKDKGTSYSDSDWTVVQNNWTAIDGTADVDWGNTYTLATIGGVNIDIKMPSSPVSEIEMLFKAGNVDKVGDATVNADASKIGKIDSYFSAGESDNTNTTLSIGSLTKTTDSSNNVNYASGLFELAVKGERDIVVHVESTGDEAGKLLIGHENRLTNTALDADAARGIAATAKNLWDTADASYTIPTHTEEGSSDPVADYSLDFYKVAFDDYGHVKAAAKVSNTLNIYTADGLVSSGSIVNYNSIGDGKVDATSVSFVGNTTNIVVEGVTNGDVAIDTTFETVGTNNVLRITPTYTTNYRGISVGGTEILATHASTTKTNALNNLNLVAGSNVRLTAELENKGTEEVPNMLYTGKVTIDAVDTWRSVKYYKTTALTTSTLSEPNDSTTDIDYNNNGAFGTTISSDAQTTINIAARSLDTNALIFGEEFTVSEGEAPEVHLEWCVITAKADGTVDQVSFEY